MASLSIQLPVTRNTVDGFTMIKDFKTLIRQNLKMLILTAPGERVMEPNFGAGIRNFLFENFDSGTYTSIDSRIRKQVREYMPVVTILDINFDSNEVNPNTLGIRVVYALADVGITDLLEFTI